MAKHRHGGTRSAQTARSAKLLRAEGWIVGNVEKYNHHTRTRNDLFGFIDLLAVRGDVVLGVQVTSAKNVKAHIAKAQARPEFPVWLASDRRAFHVHGWRAPEPTRGRHRWELAIRQVGISDYSSTITNLIYSPNRQPSPAPEPGGGCGQSGRGRRKGLGKTDFTFGRGASRGGA